MSSEEIIPTPRSRQRHRRAEALRRKALSPVRILTMILALPITIACISFGVYMRTSPYEPDEALLHIVALAGCDAARAVGVAPSYRGMVGYHTRNDPDGDGVACDEPRPVAAGTPAASAAKAPVRQVKERTVGGAKFVRP